MYYFSTRERKLEKLFQPHKKKHLGETTKREEEEEEKIRVKLQALKSRPLE